MILFVKREYVKNGDLVMVRFQKWFTPSILILRGVSIFCFSWFFIILLKRFRFDSTFLFLFEKMHSALVINTNGTFCTKNSKTSRYSSWMSERKTFFFTINMFLKCFYEDRRDVRFCVFLAIYVFRSGNQHLFWVYFELNREIYVQTQL